MKFYVSCIQVCATNNLDQNLARIADLIAQAKDEGANLALLPENACLMAENYKETLSKSYYMDGNPTIEYLASLAEKHKLWLLIGSIAIKQQNIDKLANRSILIDDSGKIICHYDKIHLFDVEIKGGESHRESDRYIAGNKSQIANTPWGKFGMSICYDLRFPYLYRKMAKDGAIFMAVPSAFTKFTGQAHWHILLRARAIETGSYIFAPAQTGSHPAGRQTYGHSLIIDPWGEVIMDAGEGEGVITAEIDSKLPEKIRQQLPSLKHDRKVTY